MNAPVLTGYMASTMNVSFCKIIQCLATFVGIVPFGKLTVGSTIQRLSNL